MDNQTKHHYLMILGLLLSAASVITSQYIRNRQFKNRRGRGERRWWVRPLNRLRDEHSVFNNLILELKNNDHEKFFEATRMLPYKFEMLLDLVRPLLEKRSRRKALPTEFRLAFTLTYLAHGGSVSFDAMMFRFGRSTAHKIIPEVCDAIWKALQPTYLPTLDTDQWKNIATEFEDKWQFPNCLGAVDGKLIKIRAPPRSGTYYYSYKKIFSIILMASCDADYRFTWVDVGQYGSLGDCSVWTDSYFSQLLEEGKAGIPAPQTLPGSDILKSFAFVGDEAFPLKTYLLRPYSRKNIGDKERVFNYRLSRARRVIENAFGILANRWQIFQKTICCSPDNVTKIVNATVCLHNFIMCDRERNNRQVYCPPNFVDQETENRNVIDGDWRNLGQHGKLQDITRLGANHAAGGSTKQRDVLRDYFVSPVGEQQAPWQYALAFRGLGLNLHVDEDHGNE